MNDFNSSISFDARMYRQDIRGSIAHATMLGEVGILTPEDVQAITDGLEEILSELQSGALTPDPNAEDIHMFIEAELTRRIGDAGKRLHTARSRNDQVALDLRLYLRDEVNTLLPLLRELIETLCRLAEQNADTVMAGYTHLQRAQPITFGHHLMAYAGMLLRDISRLSDAEERMEECPLGSGALATTTYPIDRARTAKLLGFRAPVANSLDGVADRDFCIELTAALALLMTHLSRLSEEIILWCSWEFRFIELDDAYATGSSIMPQKKNPDVTELIRGKTGRVIGDLVTLLTMMKGLPLAYNKDMQEDKQAVFDAFDTARLCVSTMTPMLATCRVKKENMRAAAAEGFLNATDCADYLVRQGVPFRDAYKVTGGLVARCIETGHTLETLPFAEYHAAHEAFGEDIYQAIALDRCVAGRTVYGGPAPESVLAQVAAVREKLTGEKV